MTVGSQAQENYFYLTFVSRQMPLIFQQAFRSFDLLTKDERTYQSVFFKWLMKIVMKTNQNLLQQVVAVHNILHMN